MFSKDPRDELLMAGPSNYGFADPGHCTAISLLQITTCLLTTKTPSLHTLTSIATMQKLVEEIGEAFIDVQLEIEDEEKVKDGNH
jgi:hypothetical protein